MLDGEGYGFEDLNNDGTAELIAPDNSFLYAFASYASSFAPDRVYKLAGTRIVDVTSKAKYRSYLSQDISRMQYVAARYSELNNNGYLGGWVAAKALIGEIDDAWNTMLASYNRNSNWTLWECEDRTKPYNCPQNEQRRVSFPYALRQHLLTKGYIDATTASRLLVPSSPSQTVSTERIAKAQPREVTAPTRITPSAPSSHSVSSGTGMFVGTDGSVLTNAHVVENCSRITLGAGDSRTYIAVLIRKDRTNDLALLHSDAHPKSVAQFKNVVRLGEGVAAFGFPLSGLLSSGGNFTLGNVTALAGIADDTRSIQISTPVQPGNSGGPLLDQKGNVVGIVTSKLNALKLAVATSDIPENVNFAIKASVATSFLSAASAHYDIGSSEEKRDPADLADIAKRISVHIKCFQ